MNIKITLRLAIRSVYITNILRLNPWCISEGLDPDSWVEVLLSERVLKELSYQIND